MSHGKLVNSHICVSLQWVNNLFLSVVHGYLTRINFIHAKFNVFSICDEQSLADVFTIE